jgi:hypothetical protein
MGGWELTAGHLREVCGQMLRDEMIERVLLTCSKLPFCDLISTRVEDERIRKRVGSVKMSESRIWSKKDIFYLFASNGTRFSTRCCPPDSRHCLYQTCTKNIHNVYCNTVIRVP